MSYLFTKDERPTMENFNNKLRGAVENAVETADFKVGDTLATVRTDLGDNWLLANGEAASVADYPDLMKLGFERGAVKSISNGYNAQLHDIACYNGTWVAVGWSWPDGTSINPYITATTDPTGEWISQEVSATSIKLNGIACYNGTWVAVGNTNATSPSPYIYTTTDPTGEWTENNIGTTSCFLTDIACYNGTWVAVGYTPSGYPRVWTTTDPTGEWTKIDVSGSTVSYLACVTCYNGTWVTVGRDANNTTVYIWTSDDPTGTWTQKAAISDNFVPTDIICHKGKWVMVGYYGSQGSWAYSSDDITTWSKSSALTLSGETATISGITCIDNTYMAVGHQNSVFYPFITTTTDPLGTWTSQQLSTDRVYVHGVAHSDNTWVVAGHSYSGTKPSIGTNLLFYLPTITIDNAYTYIKAKED